MSARRAARRRRARLTTVAVVACLLVVGSLTAWAVWPRAASSASEGDRMRVVTTTNFLTDTVRQVGGEDVDVVGLMGPGVDPHLYRPQASDLDLMRSADLVVAVGLYLEGSMQNVLDDLSRTQPVLQAGERPVALPTRGRRTGGGVRPARLVRHLALDLGGRRGA
jgi:manganese/zinc/iron transport system substrate-binding protein